MQHIPQNLDRFRVVTKLPIIEILRVQYVFYLRSL